MQLTTAGGRGETHSQACSQPAPLTHYYYYDYYYYYYHYYYYYNYYYLTITTNTTSPAAPTSPSEIRLTKYHHNIACHHYFHPR